MPIALALTLSACNDPTPPGPLAGDVLSNIAAEVQQTIAQAGQTADGVVLTAASSVEQAVDAAIAAFGNQFNTSLNELDAKTKSDIDQLSTLAAQLGTITQNTVSQVTNSVSDLLVQIGLANAPVVRSYTPDFTTAAQAANGLPITLTGTFPHAGQPGYTPVLKVNGVAQPSAYKGNPTNTLQFVLPPGTFPDNVAGITSPDIEVDIPYSKGVIFKSIVPGAFHLEIATLPDTPVRSITLTTTTPGTSTTVPHEFQTNDVYLSSLDCKNHLDQETVTPRPGWTIVPDSVTAVTNPGYPKGPSGTVDGPRVVTRSAASFTTYAATTPGICGWPVFEGGRTDFHYSYEELEPVTSAPQTQTQNLTLHWGDQRSVAVPQSPSTWKMEIVLWNGVILDAPPTAANPWVTVKDLGNTVSYSAVDLQQVTLQDIMPSV
jgi:hypothetical protein